MMFKKMKAKLKRKQYEEVLEKTFSQLALLEKQLHQGDAKYYDAWLWDDNLRKAEEYMVNDRFAKMLLEHYKTASKLFKEKVLGCKEAIQVKEIEKQTTNTSQNRHHEHKKK